MKRNKKTVKPDQELGQNIPREPSQEENPPLAPVLLRQNDRGEDMVELYARVLCRSHKQKGNK